MDDALAQAALPKELEEQLIAELKGEVISPADHRYQDARKVWNAMFDDHRPAVILRCADEEDVLKSIRAVRHADLPVAVRGGGHHVAGFGTCDGGVVIDLSRIRSTEMRNGGLVAAVGGGATLHDVDTATDAHDRSVPLGVVSPTGVGGLTLSGGVGWLTRLHGYTCDNLVAARVVTAAGEIVRTSETENPDLLWGLRGGGGNFGVVTEFEYRTHPIAGVVVAEAYHVVDSDRRVEDTLRFYREWTAHLPREATVWIVVERIGDDYDLLADSKGRLVVSLLGCCVGSAERAELHLAPMLTEGNPTAVRIRPMRMVELQHAQDGSGAAAPDMHVYMKGEMITELTDSVISKIAAHAQQLPSTGSLFEMGMLGGAMADQPRMASAMGLRNARYLAGFTMMTMQGEQVTAGTEWAKTGWSALREVSAGGTYLNFSGDENAHRVLGSLVAADAPKRSKLLELKGRYDPGNFFRINHNIPPLAQPAAQGVSPR